MCVNVSFAGISSSDIERINQDIFTATEDNYKNLKIYFSDDAWPNFSKALKDSGNLAFLKENNINTIVSYLGLEQLTYQDDQYIAVSKVMVTNHNDQNYQTNEYEVRMIFVDQNRFYKIDSLQIKHLSEPISGRMMPDCALK